jgi:integrase
MFVKALLPTAMPRGELTGMTWGQADFDGRTVTVGRAKADAGAGRQIPINPELLDVLKAHRSGSPSALEKAAQSISCSGRRVLASDPRGPPRR